MRIQMSKVAGPIFELRLKQQKTKPCSGRPSPARVQATESGATVELVAWKVSGM